MDGPAAFLFSDDKAGANFGAPSTGTRANILTTMFMSSIKSTGKTLLQGIAWLLFVAGGLAFWVGGRALHEFAKTDRLLAEMESIAITAVCWILGFGAKSAAENLSNPDEDKTPADESSQK